MNPTIPLITMGFCALLPACGTMPGGTKLGAGFSGPDLQHFILPRVRVENVSLEDALGQIVRQTHEIANQCNEEPPVLRLRYRGSPDAKVSIEMKNASLDTAIHRLAGQAGMQASFQRNAIELSPIEQDDRIATRKFLVPPSFLSDLAQPDWTPRSGLRDARINHATLLPHLRRSNVLTSPRARAHYDPSESALHVTSTGSDLVRVAGFVDSLLNTRAYMFKVEISRVALERDPSWRTGIVSEKEAERWMRSAKQFSQSAVVQNLPTVTVMPEEAGELGLVRETGSGKDQYLGTRSKFTAAPLGYGARIEFEYVRQVVPYGGREYAAANDAGLPRSVTSSPKDMVGEAIRSYQKRGTTLPVRRRTAQASLVIPEHHRLILKTRGDSKMTEYLLVRPVRIDPAGQPLTSLR